jgi:hypothetical protein
MHRLASDNPDKHKREGHLLDLSFTPTQLLDLPGDHHGGGGCAVLWYVVTGVRFGMQG